MLNVDLTRAARSHSERIAVIEAVANAAAHEPETDWIEWKSNLDVSTTEGAFKAARGILGFGNRDPSYASPFARGCAYFLVGVEPGNLAGTQPHDSANVEQWFGRYIARAEPQWSVDYLDVGGKTVMFVTVEAPQWGDEIFTLQKGFDKAKAGDVFVRLNGKTEYATPTDIRRLTERAKRADRRLNVTVDWRSPTRLQAVATNAAKAEAWAAQEQERLRPLPQPRRSRLDIGPLMLGETRSLDTFKDEVSEYSRQAPMRYHLLAHKAAVDGHLAPLDLLVDNAAEINFAKTQVTLRLPGDVRAYVDSYDIDRALDECRPPVEWGMGGISNWISRISPAIGDLSPDESKIDNDGDELVITLPPVDVRPTTRHDLKPVYLVVPDSYVGKSLAIAWRATSTSAAGDASGTLESEVADAADADALVQSVLADD